MKKKKLLIVGAGFGQLPAILAGIELGLHVIVIDKNPNAIGMKLAHENHEIDIIDKDSVLKLSRDKQIDGIITLQSDHGVPTVGYVNDKLGLKGVSYETAINCSIKTKCRLKLKEKNCSQPRFTFVCNLVEAIRAIDSIGFPCVIKSPDSSGSRGITKVNSLDELDFAIKEAFFYSNQSEVIVEEYIDGIEFGAQTFSVNGKCVTVLLHNDTLSKPPFMIPIGHSFPFKDLSKEDSAVAKIKIAEAVEAIGITDGPANIDLILDRRTREVKVIEIGARIGATCLPELVKYHTGIDWVKQTILNAIGERIELTLIQSKAVAASIISSPKDGFYQGFKFNEGYSEKDLLEFEITVKPGNLVSELRKGTDRIGKIISYGDSVESAENTIKQYMNNLNIITS